MIAIRRAGFITAAVELLLFVGCARSPAPEQIAIEYGRAIYRYDAAMIHRLASAADRRAKDEESLRAQIGAPHGFALELTRQLASFIVATPVGTRVSGSRATVTLRFKLPDANAPNIRRLVRDWDAGALDRLSAGERADVRRRLEQLNASGTLPVVEGQEAFELVSEDGTWRLVLNWSRGLPVRFGASVADTIPLEVSVVPTKIRATPGETFRVTVRATNVSEHPITTRVGHRIEPLVDADSLALLQCPLFLPATWKPGETREFVSEYLLLKDVPDRVTSFSVRYHFGNDRG